MRFSWNCGRRVFSACIPLVFAGLALGWNARGATRDGNAALDKKLIEYGWDVPFVDFVRDHIREMEKLPFDGLIFKLRGGGRVFTPKEWTQKRFAADYAAAKAVHWKKFTDNFVIMWAASKQDWFDDRQWEAITENVRLVARAARLARCVGICFDPEPYGPNPWSYARAAHRKEKSFAEYEAMARKRGAMFARAVEAELPDPVILTFFQLSLFPQLCLPMAPETRAARLAKHRYALLPAFLRGMLDAAGPNLKIVDGNESSYYYTKEIQYLRVYHRIRQDALLLVDPVLRPAYRDHVEVGQALYIDQYFDLRKRPVLSRYLTPQERAQWFEHNVYWALRTSDRYVWCYSERMNWWFHRGIPEGCEAAIRSARKKVREGQPLGYDFHAIAAAARKRREAEVAARLKPRHAAIPRIPAGAGPPRIDGRLDDAVWKQVPALEGFVALAARNPHLGAGTTAWAAWDSKFLYVAVRCREPNPQRMRPVGRRHDDPVWEGDDVELMLRPISESRFFFHFMLNPRGVRWDGRHNLASPNDVSLDYDPEWRAAAQIGKKEWSAEFAIPWRALGVRSPHSGLEIAADIGRQRAGAGELSAWSPLADGFLEPKHFGVWRLR